MNKLTLSLLATFAYNTAIAGLLTATGWMAESCGFGCNFVFSQGAKSGLLCGTST
jgi:hypothetical protein